MARIRGSELFGKMGFVACLLKVGRDFEGVHDEGTGVGVAEDGDSIDVRVVSAFNWLCTNGLPSDTDV